VVRIRNRALLVFSSYPYYSVDADTGGETSVSVSFNPSISASDHDEKPMIKGGR
jgi:hypothetical protein